eukprot:TRINITY_DN1000_c0_g1_i2.p1 TRINITY_DN1000_c0_g1~~TRINITY_DN1000_c0_g1_i2.p1  ORF type:complete len:327 (+),score=101.82 TRINITY_DN1000_c0_g1_i2:571-1551(+)
MIPGAGIGPEICAALVDVFEHAKVPIEWDLHHVSSSMSHLSEMMLKDAVGSLKRNKFGIKGVIETPIAEGHTSMNVLIRKELDLFANVTQVKSLPGVKTRFDDVDIVVIRENMEGEYSGLEHETIPGVVESLKVITEKAARRIANYAFQYARDNNRKKVTCVHKANIMKIVDGLFLETCREVAKEYPDVEYDETIVDACCMNLVNDPWRFDVMVMPNLYGNVVANVTSGLVGGPGVVSGFSAGDSIYMYEPGARHKAKDIAGLNLANPTALLLSGVEMLRKLEMPDKALQIENAVMKTLASKRVHTRDIGGKASTNQFTASVISNL